jgi:RHS repeat-associated protein
MFNSPEEQGDGQQFQQAAPSISLPKGGGAIKGIGEKFAANPVTGTGSLTVPIATSPGRSGFGPQLSLSYDSGAGNGPFGLGWQLSLPSITRKTDKGIPRYNDADESDVFILSEAEDLVPVYRQDFDGSWIAGHPGYQRDSDGFWVRDHEGRLVILEDERDGYRVRRYRPRIEGLFARIERWTNQSDPKDVYWRSISKDNITTWYGKTGKSRITDPSDPTRIFSWLICQSYDDKGNAIVYEYTAENSNSVDISQVHEKNRTAEGRSANRYLKRIKYGNRIPNRNENWEVADPTQLLDWMFEVVFDYGEGHYQTLPLDTSIPEEAQHRFVEATLSGTSLWPARQDPFSSYRAGFEVRTYRLCRRVLMFHHFPDELGAEDYLVRSTNFTYDEGPIASFITSVSQSGYTRQDDGSYLRKSLPPLDFEYSQANIRDEIIDIDPESLENLPNGLDGSQYRWVDLDGEGVSGILTEQGDGWYYKPNLSPITLRSENGRDRVVAGFGPLEQVSEKPSLGVINSGRQQLLDLAGDGQLDLAMLDGPTPGFYERTHDERWVAFRAFESLPNINWNDPNLRFIDLTGDGHADILITEENAFNWHLSLAEAGFGSGERVQQLLDEEQGPRLVFADGTQSIYLADLSGDSLVDLARIRNGEVCYWPNLGYGRFGPKVTMDNEPTFDIPDLFDQRRIRLADIDGSGTTDIIYLGHGVIDIYRNQSGNGWEDAQQLTNFPHTNDLSSVTVTDLLGNGTACLVWSSPLPGDARRPMRYLDLMGGQKPHLMISSRNNMGSETRVQYAPSTKFYLADKQAGNPWITRLPFPVHVVERVETYDHISRNRFVTRYTYHHGYFDGFEREFRGFGRVEQIDTEAFAVLSNSDQFPSDDNINQASHVPPVLTKTWFHTGVYLGRDRISNYFAGLVDQLDRGEYYREPAWLDDDTEAKKHLLLDTVLPTVDSPELTLEEERQACRALKGAMLRQEVYALDGTGDADYPNGHPYTVSEQNFSIRRLQPQEGNRYAVFFTHPREALNYHYERNPADPRVSHALTLQVDDYGNVLKSVAIGYGRRPGQSPLNGTDKEKQEQILITYTENQVTNPIDDIDKYPHNYRTPLPCESCTFEISGYQLSQDQVLFDFNAFAANDFQALLALPEIKYEEPTDQSLKQKRLIERLRTLYRKDNLTSFLPFGEVEPLALPGESYQLAFTPGLLSQVYQRGGQTLFPNPGSVLGGQGPDQGGYLDLNGDGHWWIPSGQVFYSPDTSDSADLELAHAREHFFLPHRVCDPFGATSKVTYDNPEDSTALPYDLLMLESIDPMGNRVTVGERDQSGKITKRDNDYRTLQPKLVSDPNRNRRQVAFDALGMVVGMAIMGKPGENLGDSLDGFEPDLTQDEIGDHLANPLADPHTILSHATTRLVYDLFGFYRSKDQPDPQPAVVYTLARETHDADLEPGQRTKIQHNFSYSDGFGRVVQQKVQAEQGPAPLRGANGEIIVNADGLAQLTTDDVSPRWVGSGWTVFNNKGKLVLAYEPFFTDRHDFEFDVRIGVSPILFYDPVERVITTLHPNHTYEKVLFDPWQQTTWDVNDTVAPSGMQTGDPRTDPDITGFVNEYFKTQSANWETWHTRRIAGDLGTTEQDAATKTALHANTPSTVYLDSLGRSFMTVAHNRFERDGVLIDEKYPTRVELDIEGNQRTVRDAVVQNGDTLGRVVMRYDYDMLGNLIHESSMEAGRRWMLNDVAGNPIRAWDSRGHHSRTEYDLLRRPLHQFVRGTDPSHSDPRILNQELLVEKIEYGESQTVDINLNMRTRIFKQFDGVGVVTNVAINPLTNQMEAYDFKGNLLHSTRQLVSDYAGIPNWLQNPQLDGETFTTSTTYDAINRPTSITTPDDSVTRPTYNEANLLEQLDVNLRGAGTATNFVTNIDYNARGQRTLIEYGNGVIATHAYDDDTFRLINLKTTRTSDGDLQNLHYAYDPVGNITSIQDDAQQTIFFNNAVVEPHASYMYDAIYQLVEATGREHIGQTSAPQTSWNDAARINLPHPNDGQAMRRYTEKYEYDKVGNFIKLAHTANNNGTWNRRHHYNETSLLETLKKNNRLSQTELGNIVEPYSYDPHGNITQMPHSSLMRRDYRDQLQATSRQVVNNGGMPETTYYVYDAAGKRVRKVTERQNGTRRKERLYLGDFELYREYNSSGNNVTLERETLHTMDDQQRVALVETKTFESALLSRMLSLIGSPKPLIRYQLGNHLNSVSLELDSLAQVISYEEFYPFGSTSYQAGQSLAEAKMKRYRYTGMERDEESGLNYHGARYYAPWIGRWMRTDPIGLADGVNLFVYANNKPIRWVDRSGFQGENSIDDIFKFIWAQAGFTQGRETPPTFNSGDASPFGTKAHQKATDVVADVQTAGVKGSERIYSEVAINRETGSVTRIGGRPIRAHHNIDLVAMPEGTTLTQGQTLLAGEAEVVGDIKFGGGQITEAHSAFGQRSVTVNSSFNSVATPVSEMPVDNTVVSAASKGGRGLKLLTFAIEMGIPDPTDVGLMFIAHAASIAKLKEKMRNDSFKWGFQIGLAALLLKRNVQAFEATPSFRPEQRAIGGEFGLIENPYNAGLEAAERFFQGLNTEQTVYLINAGFAGMKGKYNPQTMGGPESSGFVLGFARGISPRVEEVFEEVRKAAAKKNFHEERLQMLYAVGY